MIEYPAPPVSIPAGQMLRWSLAGSAVNDVQNALSNTATSTLTTGLMTQTFSRPLASTGATITWSGFSLPIPEGAEVQAAYPVVVVSWDTPNTDIGVGGSVIVWGGPSGSDRVGSDQTFAGSTLGSNLSDVEAATIVASQLQSEFNDWTPPDTFTVSFVGIACYLTIPNSWLNRPTVTIRIGNTDPYPAPTN